MKVNLELDLTPEELRRLFGLPDVSPINDMLVEKLGEQVEKGLDGTLVKNMAQAMLKGGTAGFEAYQNFLGAAFRGVRPKADDVSDAPPRQQRSAPTTQAPANAGDGANTGGGTT